MVKWSKADREASARSMLRQRWVLGLERDGVATVGELRSLSEERLRGFWGVGPKIIADISVALRNPALRPEDPLWSLALPTAPSIAERDEELIRMRRQGASLSQIARRFNISRERVRQILQRDGW
jgi:DNA invertase Pin-like site-specific DNA recombinase